MTKLKVGDLVQSQFKSSRGRDAHGIVVWINKLPRNVVTIKVRWDDGRSTFSYCSNLKKVQDEV